MFMHGGNISTTNTIPPHLREDRVLPGKTFASFISRYGPSIIRSLKENCNAKTS